MALKVFCSKCQNLYVLSIPFTPEMKLRAVNPGDIPRLETREINCHYCVIRATMVDIHVDRECPSYTPGPGSVRPRYSV